ncbi:GNAT family N-acetyltransferase [Bacillus sp. ISL-41]|jgi:ribosomal protein S18 acetylase RimI-like enzyme|uniref:GNAT family N-acetyltransferase n=1 Tax=Bacillaceae TaxID=186817 RepID=UPI001BE71940|nr:MULTISPECIES: GNAT family N-acetyltransferase [Bacillaceae]MBT2643526.1 GNAT family N-acetyltransferase [Bacillus sp. ISL-41]MCM3576219.1 GNAT family N-acetyltransferase [Mesobacillus subterraneus]
MTDFNVLYNPPSPSDYINLRIEAGMSGKSLEAARIGLENSLFAVTVYDDTTLVAMGRIIGDGGAFFQVVDIAVKPTYQGKGLGKLVMRKLIKYLDKHTYEGSYVSLIADAPANKLYEHFGFDYTFPNSFGMYRKY